VLEILLGKKPAAWAHFQQAIVLPDVRMSHHLSRLATTGAGLPQ
jgi:hypothetical protein